MRLGPIKTFLATALLGLLLMVMLLFTRPGLLCGYYLVKAILPGHLEIEAIRGRDIAHLQLRKLHYSNQQQRITLRELALDWKPLHLIIGRLYIRNLELSGLTIRERKSGPTKVNWEQLRAITVRSAKLNRITWIDLAGQAHVLKKLQLDTHHDNRGGTLNQLTIVGPQFTFKGTGGLQQGATRPIDFSGQVRIHRFHHTVTGKMQLFGSWKKLQLKAHLNAPFKASVIGGIDLHTHSPQLSLKANWDLLTWPLVGKPLFELPKGHIDIKGPLERYHVDFATQLILPRLPSSTISGNGYGDANTFTLATITVATLQGQIKGNAHLTLKPLKWQFAVKAHQLHPSNIWSGLHGRLNADLNGSGQGGETPAWKIHLTKLSGELQHIPLSGVGRLAFSNKGWLLSKLNLQQGKNTVAIHGAASDTIEAHWAINLPDLSKINRQIRGRIVSRGHLTQQGLSTQTRIQGLHSPQLSLEHLSLLATTEAVKQRVALKIKQGDNLGQFNAYVLRQGELWPGVLTQANIRYNQHHWKIQRPVKFRLSEQAIEVDNHHWFVDQKKVLAGFRYHNANHWALQLSAQAIPTNALPQLSQAIHVDSTLQLKLDATQTEDHFNATLQAKLNGGKLAFLVNEQPQSEAFQDLALDALFNAQGFRAAVHGRFGNKQTVQGSITLPELRKLSWPSPFQPCRGEAKIHFPNLTPFTQFIPNVSQLKGHASMSLTLAGSIDEPSLSGRLKMQDLTVSIPILGVTYKNIQFLATSDAHQQNQICYQGSGSASDGTFNLHGHAYFKANKMHTTTQLHGNRVKLINTDEYKIRLSPTLKLVSQGKNLTLTGDVVIPEATIAPRNFSQTVEMPIDVIYVNDIHYEPLPYALTSDINLKLGENVKLNVLGIRGKVTGQVQVHDTPDTTMNANGELDIVNGRYEAYGKNLKIKRGTLHFSGGRITNPGLNVHAERVVMRSEESAIITTMSNSHLNLPTTSSFSKQNNPLRVGVNVTGTLEKPVVTLFSYPNDLADAEILSYLIFNHSTAKVSSDPGSRLNHNQLLNAIPAIGLSSATASRMTHELQHALGLDQMEITGSADPLSSNLADTSISIGKAINHRLYINYTYGLFSSKNALRIRYLVNPRWTLQTEAITDTTSSTQSLDFIYNITK